MPLDALVAVRDRPTVQKHVRVAEGSVVRRRRPAQLACGGTRPVHLEYDLVLPLLQVDEIRKRGRPSEEVIGIHIDVALAQSGNLVEVGLHRVRVERRQVVRGHDCRSWHHRHSAGSCTGEEPARWAVRHDKDLSYPLRVCCDRAQRHAEEDVDQRRPRPGLRYCIRSVHAARKRSVFESSLCLSRACLGKKIIFINKWLKKTVFAQIPMLKIGLLG